MNATAKLFEQETLISQLKDDLRIREEKIYKSKNELRHLLESIAILISIPNRIIEPHESAIKDRICEILTENKDNILKVQNLKDKINSTTKSVNHQSELIDSMIVQIKNLEDERHNVGNKLNKLESKLEICELSRNTLRHDKDTFLGFLEKLGNALQLNDIRQEIGNTIYMESLLRRTEQLVLQKSHSKALAVQQLQRRIKILHEELHRRDLHVDLLRNKLKLQEDSLHIKPLLQSERDEANFRVKKIMKQLDQMQIKLNEEKSSNRQLSIQLAEAADYKIAALEGSRKIEELKKQLIESDMLKMRYNYQLTVAKEQLRNTNETTRQEHSIKDNSIQLLRNELIQVKQNLSEVILRESQLQDFRVSVIKLLSIPICSSDYEIVCRIKKIVDANLDFTMLSRRYEESEASPSRCASIHQSCKQSIPALHSQNFNNNDIEDLNLHEINDGYKRSSYIDVLPP